MTNTSNASLIKNRSFRHKYIKKPRFDTFVSLASFLFLRMTAAQAHKESIKYNRGHSVFEAKDLKL